MGRAEGRRRPAADATSRRRSIDQPSSPANGIPCSIGRRLKGAPHGACPMTPGLFGALGIVQAAFANQERSTSVDTLRRCQRRRSSTTTHHARDPNELGRASAITIASSRHGVVNVVLRVPMNTACALGCS